MGNNILYFKKYKFLVITAFFIFYSCENNQIIENNDINNSSFESWLIDDDFIQWGCSGQDCIPNLDSPISVDKYNENLNYLDDNDLVVGVKVNDSYIAYPHSILNWHEVINEQDYTISYCPLTGSALNINSNYGFGVSGMLYNSNLIMYDKSTNSYWPQMFLKSAFGEEKGTKIPMNPLLETTWKTWKLLFPETKAISSNTGYSRDYNSYPYGDYKNNQEIFFPMELYDYRLPAKERVLGILLGDKAKAFVISQMGDIYINNLIINGDSLVIFGSKLNNFAIAYKTELIFNIDKNNVENGELLFIDTFSDSKWNILGEAISGEMTGTILEPIKSYISYWFAWVAFNPQTEIYNIESFCES